MISSLAHRAVVSLTTVPSAAAWYRVAGITLVTTCSAGAVAAGTDFVDPRNDLDPPRTGIAGAGWKALSALFFPSLVEEVLWRGILLPPPTLTTATIPWMSWACGILVIHVLSHPVAARTVWPRGRNVFDDPRFLVLATMVLGGATVSYWVSGGSAWAAAVTHGVPVALWRDFLGGEAKLMGKDQQHFHKNERDGRRG